MRSSSGVLRLAPLAVVVFASCGGSQKIQGAASERLVAPSTGVLFDTPGELRMGDAQTSTGGLADQYEIQVAAGQRLTIACTSNSLDTYLIVQAPGSAPIANDDYQGDRTRAQVELQTAAAGPLKITVTTYAPGAQGAYRVTVAAGDATSATAGGAHPSPTWPVLALNTQSQGQLAAGDPVLPSGQVVDNYLLPGGQNVPAEIAVQGAGGTPMLVVTTPSGQLVQAAANAGGRAAAVVPLGEPGSYRIQVVSGTAGPGGGYSISVLPAAASAPTTALTASHHQVGSLLATPATTATPVLGLDSTTSEVLQQGDGQIASGELVDRFLLTASANQSVTIDLQSTEFDPYLILVAPSGRQWQNDDANGGRDAQLAVALPEPGTYQVLATSYRPGMHGRFVLKVRRGLQAGAPPADASTAAATALGTTLIPIGPGTSVPTNPALLGPTATGPSGRLQRTGELAQGDTALRSGELYDTFTFTWAAGERVTLRLTSSAFDPYLVVRSPSGQQNDNDDLQQGNTEAGLDLTVRETGTHSVLVTSYRSGESGAYSLTINGGGGGGAPGAVAGNAPAAPSGDVISGALDRADRPDAAGKRVDRHSVRVAANEAVRFELVSSEFDTLLMVQPPGGSRVDNDDAVSGNTNSAVDLVARQAGTCTVTVTSYRPGEQGRYELRVIRTPSGGVLSPGAQPAPGLTPIPIQIQPVTPIVSPMTPVRPVPVTPMQPGQPVPVQPVVPAAPSPAPAAAVAATPGTTSGSLGQGDQQLRSGEFVDNISLQGTAGETIHLRLTSAQFDPYLILKMPSGRQEDNDDLTPQTRDAGLVVTLTESGQHTIMVTSYRAGEQGAYSLTLQRQTPGSAPGGNIAAPPGAASGRVFGIFAGISDYPTQNDLPECANDARKLAEDLRRTNLMTADQQILLTDGQATTTAIRQAFASMAQRVTPGDVFVFFYSGHGGQRPAQGDPNELDRQDETILLYDAEMLDNEMAQLFGSIRGRVDLIALDSCFSGGFAKDVITSEGRMGLFSSEEDLTSSVAGQFQAGGYLSHFLRTGIVGEADMSPRDGQLTAGELSHYLYRQFGAHVGDVGATDQNFARSFQHLVVDRGAVHVSDVLFAYR